MSVLKNRLFHGAALITGFALGLWLLRMTIVQDINRMFLWQKILFWIGDVFAILCVLRWMFQSENIPDHSVSKPLGLHATPRENHVRTISGRSFSVLLLFSLLTDMGVTFLSQASEYRGLKRAMATTATIHSIEESKFSEATHWKFEFSYQDINRQTMRSRRTLTYSKSKPILPWMVKPLEIAIGEVESDSVEVMYDPLKSTRVWFKDQNMGSTTGIGVLFSIIHLFQLIVTLSIISSLWNDSAKKIAPDSFLHLLPLAIETGMLLILGMTLYQ